MKILISAILALAASSAAASNITVVTPANNSQVSSTFQLAASTTTCGGVPAASMGYSIDSGTTTIEPTAFTAKVSASTGAHVLHVKCWGQQTHDEQLLNITVGTTAPVSNIQVSSPVNGAELTSPFTVTASTTTCGGVPAVSMGYSIDSGTSTIEPTAFTATASASTGAHVLHVKCWGHQTNSQQLLNITIGKTVSSITITSPSNGARIVSPFTLAASSKTCDSESATSMAYSIDGGAMKTEPTSFSVPVTARMGTHAVTLKCFGLNVQSQVSLTVDVVQMPVAATPQFSLPSGTYTSQQAVTISETTAGALVHYTTDGSAPSALSPQYSGTIAVKQSMVLQAVALASGYQNSGYARASYEVTQVSGPTVPSNAIQVKEVQTLPNWRIKHDPATGGSATGSMTIVGDPSLSGQTAEFNTSFTNYGGILYSVTYGNDPVPMNFLYDAQVWIEAGSVIGNLEMDNNQVIDNGDTMIYAFQCAGDSGTWDYSENAGTPANPIVKWVHSTQPCNPGTWTTNTWHHVQISYSRDDLGNVTYHSVWLDGVEAPINETVMSEFALNWAAGDLIANFQVDGKGSSGSATLNLDEFTISRW